MYVYIYICIDTEVWNRGTEQRYGTRYGTDPSSRYGTGVWNGCGPGPCSGPSNLTCIHMYIYIYMCIYICIYIYTLTTSYYTSYTPRTKAEIRIMKKWVEDMVVAKIAWGCRNGCASHQSTVKMMVLCIPEIVKERRNDPSKTHAPFRAS